METRGVETRREFVKSVLASGLGFTILRNARSAYAYAENEKLNIALVGVGGRGRWFVDTIPTLGENVVALCDVDERKAAEAYARFPELPGFHDYRVMLDKMAKGIDAVIIATPDHSHAPCAALAIGMGRHVLCEKPLTRTVREARALRELASQHGAATQMGNQGTATPQFRRAVDLIRAGVIGAVGEVLVWNGAGGPGPRPIPEGSPPVPDGLAWDLWLGPAPARAYHADWMRWHAWRDFGTGQLGNWASHTANMAFMALKLNSLWVPEPGQDVRIRLEREVPEISPDSFPRWERIHFSVPARGDLPPATVKWLNGPTPGGREYIEERLGRRLDWGDAGERKWADHAGTLIIGSEGRVHATGHNATYGLLPEGRFQELEKIPESLPRSPGHEREWLAACKGGPAAMSNFDYAGPLTEFLMLGNVATQFAGPIEFDPLTCRITNDPDADAALDYRYREGWSL